MCVRACRHVFKQIYSVLTFAAIWKIWVAMVALQALTNVTSRATDQVDTLAICFTCKILPLLSRITWIWILPNCPIKNRWKFCYALQLLKT
ncbi:hypothetical protein PRUPE_4G094400 [Prunus persica]|uniref:Uncharacterized protein n=1 Tax=Prunus persica TaxID=3760 RepID=A0A251PI31_PRUPE|nr:hypothetical protein PRUPE_4G094400 [Prunus persica]